MDYGTKPALACLAVALLALPWAHDVSHDPANLLGCEELTRTLSLTLREFPEQVFVSAPKKIGLDILQTKPIARIRKRFHNSQQRGVADLAAGGDALVPPAGGRDQTNLGLFLPRHER